MKLWGDTIGLAILFTLLIMATAAKAKSYCVFTTECFEADACQDAAFRFDFIKGGAAGAAQLNTGVQATTEFGDLGGYILKQTPDAATYAFEAPGTFYFLTVADREARLTTHLPGPMSVHYLGTCEDLG